MRKALVYAVFVSVLFAGVVCAQATDVVVAPVKVRLIAEDGAVAPGTTTWVGIYLQHQPHWHTYWTNPGDSGLPTRLTWSVPYGFVPGDIAWPAPQRFDLGGLYNFGYDGDVVLPVRMGVSRDARPGSTAHLSVAVKWLVCHEECVPGKATLKLDLKIAATTSADPRWKTQFALAHAAQPQPTVWSGEAHVAGAQVEVTLRGAGLPPQATLQVFPVQPHVIGYAPPQVHVRADAMVLTFAKSDYYTSAPATLDLVLKSDATPQARSWSVSLPFSAAASATPQSP
jgi:DsbC/DsbD-like thiol-disulfide interchange protein